jgi:hypothetical protein
MKSTFYGIMRPIRKYQTTDRLQTKSNLFLVMCQSKIFEIWAESLAELSVQVTLFLGQVGRFRAHGQIY